MNTSPHISNNKIRQVIMLAVIIMLMGVILFNLSDFLPSLLGAITLYIVFRSINFKLVEGRKWKPWIAALTIIFITLIVIILPSYFLIDFLVQKIGNYHLYADQFNIFIDRVQDYLQKNLNINLLSKENKQKIAEFARTASASIINTTLNALSVIAAMFFILYFMFTKGRVFERILMGITPLKRSNGAMIGEKFRKMVVANAIGIPLVALGQAITALIGYLIFGASNPFLLFTLTFFTSMIPVVGASIVYIPVGVYMLAIGDTTGGIGIILYGLLITASIDNVLRFTLLKKLENIDPLTTVFGIILGLKLFGFLGLIFGPILVSITILLMQIYSDEFAEEKEEHPNLITSLDEEKPSENVDVEI